MNSRPALVNNQFNSPMKLYSAENVADTLNKQTQILANGALGIDFHQMAAPGNLANSAVLRMLEEEARNGGKENIPVEYSKPRRRVQRFEWPPKGVATNFDANNNSNDNSNDNEADANNNETRKFGLVRRDADADADVWCTKRPRHHFTTTTAHLTYAGPGVKCVSWPPPPEHKVKNVIEKQLVYSQESAQPPTFSPAAPLPASSSAPPVAAPWSPNAAPWSPSSVNAPAQPAPVYQRIVQAPAPIYEPPPTFVTLRQQAPVSQVEAPVFPSQPAATHTRALPFTRTPKGTMMRGDQKWPPAEQKAQAVAENEARQALAKGPAVRPRAVKKDYSQFFAQNAITTTYPGYRAPPGTQHYVEDGTSNF